MRFDRVWRNARLATMRDDGLGVVEAGAVAARDGRIAYAGPEADLPPGEAAEATDCAGRWITPGLIDCHTHLVHAGHRAEEWQARLAGERYEAIARAGGGIMATVRATRAADEAVLLADALPRVDRLIAEGVTTVEVKSGYGLDLPAEMAQLRTARALATARPIGVSTSFLALHALPPEFADRDAYAATVCDAWLPAVAAGGLADAVDAFCEPVAFTPAQVARLFNAARAHGLPVRLHADQLSDGGGAALAADHGALSADHLEYASPDGVAAMARAGTVAVLLPGAFHTLQQDRKPPVAALRAAGVPMAVATDCNPGTSPLTSLLLATNLAATLFGLSVAECLRGVTRHAARALGRDDLGVLRAGCACDLAVWDVETLAELPYRMGDNRLHQRVWGGA